MELYEEVVNVLVVKYRISESFAESLIQDIDDDEWDRMIDLLMDEYDIAAQIYNG